MQKVKRLKQFIFMFICGMSDSVSLYWVRKILFATHPITKVSHPSSFRLIKTFKDAFIQVIFLFICLPAILDFIGLDFIGKVVQVVFLLLSYGYLFFYNIQVMSATKQIALWSSKFPHTYFCQFDVKEKFDALYAMSNLIKNFIFLLLFYTPLNLLLMIVQIFFPILGSILLVISESFFSAAFYYLEKWPYDRFNIAFIEKNVAYMLGYGFFVAFICNALLDGFLGIAAFFLISLWMMINCQLYSPPPIDQFNSFSQLFQCIKSPESRSKLPNAFNIHRQKLRKEKQYRKQLTSNMKIVKPALLLTEFLNKKLGKRFQKRDITQENYLSTQKQKLISKQNQLQKNNQNEMQDYSPIQIRISQND